jgi:hypothetical protein
MKICRQDIGRWVTVKWSDVGRRDCLLVEVDDDYKRMTVFEPYGALHHVDADQIVEKRRMLKVE